MLYRRSSSAARHVADGRPFALWSNGVVGNKGHFAPYHDSDDKVICCDKRESLFG